MRRWKDNNALRVYFACAGEHNGAEIDSLLVESILTPAVTVKSAT